MNKPFFAQFLEEQDLVNVSGGGKAQPVTVEREGPLDGTLKYPSDNDEDAELAEM